MEKVNEKVFAIGFACVITLQEIERALSGLRDTGVVLKQVVRVVCILHQLIMQQDEVGPFLCLKRPRLIPIRDLNTDEHTDDDNTEVNKNREPVFFFDMGFDTTEYQSLCAP